MNQHQEIQNLFKREIQKEIFKNEIFRLKFLFIFFVFVALLFFYYAVAHREVFEKILGTNINRFYFPLFFVLVACYFLVLIYTLRFRERNFKQILAFPRYLNAFIEISLPSLVFVALAEIRKPYSIYAMLTPPLVVYFVFIIASGFRLDFKISIFTAAVASLEYLTLSAYYFFQGFPETQVSYLVILPSFFIRSLLLFVSGIMIGYLTSQIQKRLMNNFVTIYEKEKITRIFGRHVSHKVAEKIINEENLSETKFVCILFFDIRNFTSFSEHRSPQDVVNFLNKTFEICVKIIEKNNGIVNKFLGDGFMAIFGAPVSSNEDVSNALQSALEIKANLKFIEEGVGFGIGLHCGNAVVGQIGSEDRKEYTVIGDTVNLASRIEQLNKTYNTQILFSKDVCIHSNCNEAKFIDKINVKGREESVEIYTL